MNVFKHRANAGRHVIASGRLEVRFACFHIPELIAPDQADDTSIHIAAANFDDDRRTFAHIIPALARSLAGPRIKKHTHTLSQG